MKSIDQALKLDPNHPFVYLGRSMVFGFLLNDNEHALTDVNHALALEPDLAEAYGLRGALLVTLKDYQHALADLNYALNLNSGLKLAYLSRSTLYFQLEDYQHAKADIDQLLTLDDTDPCFYLVRGTVCAKLEEYREAIADLDRAIEPSKEAYLSGEMQTSLLIVLTLTGSPLSLDNVLREAYAWRGDINASLKDYQQAIEDYTYAIDSDPNYATAYADRGDAHFNLGNYGQAIADYNRAIGLGFGDLQVYNRRGIADLKLSNYEQAIVDHSQAIELSPENVVGYAGRGDAHFNLGNYEQAITDYGRVIELGFEDAQVYKARGLAHFSLGHYEQAIADYSRAVKLDAENTFSYASRGNAHLRFNERQQAAEDYRRAIELDSKNINYRWMLEWIKMNKQRASIETGERLAEIALMDPHTYVAYVCQGIALGIRSNLKGGLAELEQAILLEPEEWDAYFWKGLLSAYYFQRGSSTDELGRAIEQAINVGLPPPLLAPLYWLEQDLPDVFATYVRPLLERYGV